MSISGSLYTGKSSILCLGKKMQALGDNIANISTTGFRASKLNFDDILSEAVKTGGVRLNARGVVSDFSQDGPVEDSHEATNMAITGEGFFILSDKDDASVTYYTRAGEFCFDSNGYLTNPAGHLVQGYQFDDQGNEGTTLGEIQLELTTPAATPTNPDPQPRLVSSPSASTKITLISNVDAGSEDHAAAGLFNSWDATNQPPIALIDYEHRADHYLYDSTGDRKGMAVYFDKTAQGNVWEYLVTATPEGTATAADDGVLARGNITFDSYGYVIDMTIENYQGGAWTAGTPGSNGYLTFQTPFTGVQAVELDMGVRYAGGQWVPDTQTTTQFGYGSYTKFSNTDGYGEGDFIGFSVTTDGIIRARFDNGVISDLFRVGLANALDPSSQLRRIGSTLYKEDTNNSGGMATGRPNDSGMGSIIGNSLEQSNVELVEEFGDLIFTQKAIQANAKGIITADEIIRTAIGLKR